MQSTKVFGRIAVLVALAVAATFVFPTAATAWNTAVAYGGYVTIDGKKYEMTVPGPVTYTDESPAGFGEYDLLSAKGFLPRARVESRPNPGHVIDTWACSQYRVAYQLKVEESLVPWRLWFADYPVPLVGQVEAHQSDGVGLANATVTWYTEDVNGHTVPGSTKELKSAVGSPTQDQKFYLNTTEYIQPVSFFTTGGIVGVVDMRVSAYAASGKAWAMVDPLITIDPEATVTVEGQSYRISDYFELTMSPGFRYVTGAFAAWNNPGGGLYEDNDNWRTWDDSGVPPDMADVQFTNLDGVSQYTVTASAPHGLAKLMVHDASLTMDLGGTTFAAYQGVEIGDEYSSISSLDLRNGTLASDGAVTLGAGSSDRPTLTLSSGAVLSCPNLDLKASQAKLVMDGGSLETASLTGSGRKKIVFNGGHMTLTGGQTDFRPASGVYSLGDGNQSACLSIEGGRRAVFQRTAAAEPGDRRTLFGQPLCRVAGG